MTIAIAVGLFLFGLLLGAGIVWKLLYWQWQKNTATIQRLTRDAEDTDARLWQLRQRNRALIEFLLVVICAIALRRARRGS